MKVDRFIRLGDVAEFRNGLNFSKESRGDGCTLIGIPEFQDRFAPDYDSLPQIDPSGVASEEDYLEKNDIIFVRSNGNKALVGRSLFIDQEITALFSGFCIRARIFGDELDPRFFAYFTRSKHFKKSIASSAGTNINNLNQNILGDVSVPWFNTDQQLAIAKVLSTLDDKIEINNRINEELEGLAKLLYDYWFVQFDFPISTAQAAAMGDPALEGKPYRQSGGKMVYNPTIKHEIPEGWETAEVGEVLAKQERTTKVPNSEILAKGDTPVIDQSSDFVCGFTNDSEAIITNIPKIVFGDHTRVVKFINFTFARGADGTQLLSSDDPRLPPVLFYHQLRQFDLSNYGYARHFKFLKEQKICLPTEEVAKQFAREADRFFALLRNNTTQNQHLTELRDWLLPMLMNGQVTVG